MRGVAMQQSLKTVNKSINGRQQSEFFEWSLTVDSKFLETLTV